jgi:uncharacterized Zn finger protein (UPF0148 family)
MKPPRIKVEPCACGRDKFVRHRGRPKTCCPVCEDLKLKARESEKAKRRWANRKKALRPPIDS